MNDACYNDLLDNLTETTGKSDWYMVKEHQPWGYCPTFKRKATGTMMLRMNGQWYNRKEAREHIIADWRPVSADDQKIYRQIEQGVFF